VIDPWNPLSVLREVVDLHERTTADMLAMLAKRLEDRRLSASIGGQQVEGLVGWIAVRGSGEPHQMRVELRDVDYDGWRLDAVAVAADEVRMRAFPLATVTATGIRVDGRTALAPLIAWLDRRLRDWSLALDHDGKVEARHTKCPGLRLTVEPAVVDHRLHLELCGVRWHRVQFEFPNWLRLRRTVTLPALPLDATVLDARRRGDSVDLRLTIPEVNHSLSPSPPQPG